MEILIKNIALFPALLTFILLVSIYQYFSYNKQKKIYTQPIYCCDEEQIGGEKCRGEKVLEKKKKKRGRGRRGERR